MDYTIKRKLGWYAVVYRNGNKIMRGPFWWEWVAELAMFV